MEMNTVKEGGSKVTKAQENLEKTIRKKRKMASWEFIATIVILVGLIAGLIYAIKCCGLDIMAKFGDSFAPITGLVSALALVFAIVSINLQRKELKLQRKQLKAQSEELKRTADAQEAMLGFVAEQTEVMKTQASVARLQLEEIKERPFREVVDRMMSDLLEDEKDIIRCIANYQMDMERYFTVNEDGRRISAAGIRKNVMHWEKYFQRVGFTMIPDQNRQRNILGTGWESTLKSHVANAWAAKADERRNAALDDIVALASGIKDPDEKSKTNYKWGDIISRRHNSLKREISQRLGPL